MGFQTEREIRGDYKVIGSTIDAATVAVSTEPINELYDYVSESFLPTMVTATPDRPKLKDIGNVPGIVIAGDSFGMHPDRYPDLKVGSYTGLLLSHQDVDTWRLRVLSTRYRHDGTFNKIMSRYFIDVVGGNVTKARREMLFIFQGSPYARKPSKLDKHEVGLVPHSHGKNTDTFDNLYDALKDEDNPSDLGKLMYERPLREQDCERLTQLLQRVARRCIHTSPEVQLAS